LFVVALLYSLIARWLAGILPKGNWTGYDVYDLISGPVSIVGILAFYYYLDDAIAEAIERSRSISSLSDEEFERFRHELIVIPLWPHLIVGSIAGAALVYAAIETYGLPAVQASNALVLLEWALVGFLTFGFAYRVIRLIVLIGRFNAGPIRLSLYNLPPLYELSTVAAKAGLFLLVLWYLNLAFNLDERFLEPSSLITVIVVSLIPLAAFLVPHAVLSRRLSREKTSLVVGVSQQLESAFEMHRRELEAENFDHMEPVRAAIETLISEKEFIEATPAWPWRLGTFRVVVTAVLVSVIVWLVQTLLERILGC
jgi:hypothetical protein